MSSQKPKALQNFTQKKEIEAAKAPEVSDLNLRFKYLWTLRGTEYDQLYNELKDKINDTGKTMLRERNFLLIQEELLKYVRNNQTGLPTVSRLSMLTNLSRVTVGKHLKAMLSAELEEDRKLQHKYLFDVILTNIGDKALSGDIKYMKLYVDTMIKLEEKDSIKMYIKNQQNNILVNEENK